MESKMIFMADDDSEDQFIIEEAMDDLAKGVFNFFSNGEELIKGLQDIPPEASLPKLIVLDLNMPKMNGRQTLEFLKLHKRFCTIPVIIYSTSLNVFEKERCMMLGAESYIMKPLSYEESLDTAKAFFSFL